MSDEQQPEDINVSNENSFQDLTWTIEQSVGEFVLILARCNYMHLRERLVQRLHEECSVEIREIHLEESVKTLYTTIVNVLQQEQPPAVMVLGLESVREIETVLTSTNQVREEFRKHFAFPLVLWVNDWILRQMIRLVPDLKSWTTTFNFAIATDELIDSLRRSVEEVFSAVLDAGTAQLLLNVTISEGDRLELNSAVGDLQSREQELEPELLAGVQFLLGRDAYASGQIDQALYHYQTSLKIWQQTPNNPSIQNRLGVLLFHLGLCHLRYAELQQSETPIQAARDYFQQCVDVFEDLQRPDLVAKFIGYLGEMLQRLQQWDELHLLAKKSQSLHETYGTPVLLAQDYGFLAAVAKERSQWQQASQAAERAWEIWANATEAPRSHQGLYLLQLAEAEQMLGQLPSAVSHLERARHEGVLPDDPKLYIRILEQLQKLYFQQGEYLKAFEVKQKRRSIEQQFGFRAFIGAGRLEPQQQAQSTLVQGKNQETVALEIEASGRQEDVKRLIERMTRDDCKLTVIHGQSGVGKSSIVNAGLVPALKQRTIASREVLPVVLRVYHNWVEDFGRLLGAEETGGVSATGAEIQKLIEQLRQNQQRNLLTVLIFDQFEEFFFLSPEAARRKPFFEFLAACLNIPFVKVILSLREDYLHYLLECNRLPELSVINNNILDKNLLYYLGNFSRADTQLIIERLTERTRFKWEPALVEHLVDELAAKLGEVRPIELQVMGAQLQTEKIITLLQYRERGPKAKLVERYLEAVIQDCGSANERAARSVLYLLTDENNTRPLKTRTELAKALAAEANKLDLVLKIFVDAGLLFSLPAVPNEQYQLVHDSLVTFIRQQEGLEILAELEQERQQRIRSEAKYNRFLKQALAGAGVAILGLIGLACLAWVFALKSQKQEKLAVARQLAVQAEQLTSQQQIELGTLLAVESTQQFLKLDDSSVLEADRVLRNSSNRVLRNTSNLLGIPVARLSHESAVTAVAFSPDGKSIATASYDNTARVWDATSGKELHRLSHEGIVTAVAFSPDGKSIATASYDNTARVWDVTSGKELHRLSHKSTVTAVAFSPDGKSIATASFDSTARVWDATSSQELHRLSHKSLVTAVAFSPDGKSIATASWDSTARVWDATSGQELHRLSHEGIVIDVAFSPDGKSIATASLDHTARVWDATSGQQLHRLSHESALIAVAFSPDGKSIATASEDNTARVWDAPSGQQLLRLSHESAVVAVAFSPDGKSIATASRDKTARVWDATSGQQLRRFSHEDIVIAVAFSPDGKSIVTASVDKTARVWDATSDRELHRLSHESLVTHRLSHESLVTDVAFSPDGKSIATASVDKTARVWDATSGQQLLRLRHESALIAVAFSPDGKSIATASWGSTARVWDATSGQQLLRLSHESAVTAVAFSPDGKSIATASYDHTARVWDATSGKELHRLSHKDVVRAVAFSPDGKSIATASLDKTARVWDVTSGQELLRLSHEDTVIAVAFSPDGKSIATASLDKTAQVASLQPKDLIALACKHLTRNLTSEEWSQYMGNQQYRQTCPNLPIHPSFSLKTVKTEKDADSAVAILSSILKQNPKNPDPDREARQLVASLLIEKGQEIVVQDQVNNAIAAYKQAQKLDPTLKISARSWNILCWHGSLHKNAVAVLNACDKAVMLAPQDGNIRDSRGLARALTGNTSGAIEDFQAFINLYPSAEKKSRRQGWIKALRAGINPFTPEELESLRHE